MKTLYVSDLDGTLLNMNQELNNTTINKLNELINKGVNFTVSTGRGDSVKTILKDVKLTLPAMILNGALNYDFLQKKYVNKKTIPVNKALEIIKIVNSVGFKKFEIQTIINDTVKRFAVKEWDIKTDCLALNILNDNERMQRISTYLKEINGINFFIHKKVYSNNEWFCDIVLENVSKASALQEFKEKYKFDKVVAFGDSENDLPLSQVADEFYAVANSVDIVKKNATAVIGNCYEDGVVNFIECNI